MPTLSLRTVNKARAPKPRAASCPVPCELVPCPVLVSIWLGFDGKSHGQRAERQQIVMSYMSGHGTHNQAPQGYRLPTFFRPSSGGTEKGGSPSSFHKCIDPITMTPTRDWAAFHRPAFKGLHTGTKISMCDTLQDESLDHNSKLYTLKRWKGEGSSLDSD